MKYVHILSGSIKSFSVLSKKRFVIHNFHHYLNCQLTFSYDNMESGLTSGEPGHFNMDAAADRDDHAIETLDAGDVSMEDVGDVSMDDTDVSAEVVGDGTTEEGDVSIEADLVGPGNGNSSMEDQSPNVPQVDGIHDDDEEMEEVDDQEAQVTNLLSLEIRN